MCVREGDCVKCLIFTKSQESGDCSKNLVIFHKIPRILWFGYKTGDFFSKIPRFWWLRENSGSFLHNPKNLVISYKFQESGDFLQNPKNLVISWEIWCFFYKFTRTWWLRENLVIYEIPRNWWFLTKSQASGDFVKNLVILFYKIPRTCCLREKKSGDFLQNPKNLVISWIIWWFVTKSQESDNHIVMLTQE